MQRQGTGVPENARAMAPLVSPKAAVLVHHLGQYKVGSRRPMATVFRKGLRCQSDLLACPWIEAA